MVKYFCLKAKAKMKSEILYAELWQLVYLPLLTIMVREGKLYLIYATANSAGPLETNVLKIGTTPPSKNHLVMKSYTFLYISVHAYTSVRARITLI